MIVIGRSGWRNRSTYPARFREFNRLLDHMANFVCNAIYISLYEHKMSNKLRNMLQHSQARRTGIRRHDWTTSTQLPTRRCILWTQTLPRLIVSVFSYSTVDFITNFYFLLYSCYDSDIVPDIHQSIIDGSNLLIREEEKSHLVDRCKLLWCRNKSVDLRSFVEDRLVYNFYSEYFTYHCVRSQTVPCCKLLMTSLLHIHIHNHIHAHVYTL